MRFRRQYVIRGQVWRTVWKTLPKHEATRVRWASREIELDPWLRKQPRGMQEFLLRHELLHVVLRSRKHVLEKISHGRVVEIGMALDNLIHFGADEFKGNV